MPNPLSGRMISIKILVIFSIFRLIMNTDCYKLFDFFSLFFFFLIEEEGRLHILIPRIGIFDSVHPCDRTPPSAGLILL